MLFLAALAAAAAAAAVAATAAAPPAGLPTGFVGEAVGRPVPGGFWRGTAVGGFSLGLGTGTGLSAFTAGLEPLSDKQKQDKQ